MIRIYYPSIRNINRLIKQRKRSFKRKKSSAQSLYYNNNNNNLNIDDNFCPYTRKMLPIINENEGLNKKKFEIGCPMEETCADMRIMNEYVSRMTTKKNLQKYVNQFLFIFIKSLLFCLGIF